MWTREELDWTGGYDCMYAGIEIKFKGKVKIRLDGRDFGQESCDADSEEALNAATEMNHLANDIVLQLNSHNRIELALFGLLKQVERNGMHCPELDEAYDALGILNPRNK